MIVQTFLAGFFLQASVPGPALNLVTVPQVPANRSMRASARPIVAQGATGQATNGQRAQPPAGVSVDAQGRMSVSRTVIEACGRAALGRGAAPEGVDCPGILTLVEAERRRTAEGNLLRLLGREGEVTQSSSRGPTNVADADSVARGAASGDADAAAVAARLRSGTPPPTQPR